MTGCGGLGSAIQMNRREYSFVSRLKIYKDKEALYLCLIEFGQFSHETALRRRKFAYAIRMVTIELRTHSASFTRTLACTCAISFVLVAASCAPNAASATSAVATPTTTPASAAAGSLASPAVCPVPRAPTSVSSADRGTQPYDRDVWQTLLYHHAKIRRTVTMIDNGVSAVTESDDPAVATLIKDHALAMRDRMVEGRQVRVWDPVFKELFARHTHVKLAVELTEKGVRIVETGDDAETVRLLRSHASGVSDFVRVGSAAAQRETPYIND